MLSGWDIRARRIPAFMAPKSDHFTVFPKDVMRTSIAFFSEKEAIYVFATDKGLEGFPQETCRSLPFLLEKGCRSVGRRDLYYRLNVFPSCWPACESAGKTFLLIVTHFGSCLAAAWGNKFVAFPRKPWAGRPVYS